VFSVFDVFVCVFASNYANSTEPVAAPGFAELGALGWPFARYGAK